MVADFGTKLMSGATRFETAEERDKLYNLLFAPLLLHRKQAFLVASATASLKMRWHGRSSMANDCPQPRCCALKPPSAVFFVGNLD